MKKMIVLVSLLFFSCINTLDIAGAGGSSETQNGFTATALLPDGSPAKRALVRVRPSNYFADTANKAAQNDLSVIDTITDDSGKFTIKRLEVGEYYVEVNDSQTFAGLIHFSAGAADSILQTDTVMLYPYAQVMGKIDSVNQHFKYVQIKGMERITAVSQDGSFSFGDLPEGTYTFRIVSDDSRYDPLTIDSVNVLSSSINIVGYRLAKTIILNTTVTGADVSEDVFSFPVLIRFGEAENLLLEDTSVLFTKWDGTVYPHQIELWDSSDGTGAIWVNVDTLRGNDSTLLYMHYGSGSPVYNSDNQVFAADQFAGVWHLNEMSGNDLDGYKDATIHGRDGTGINMESGKITTGLIGRCQELNGVDGFIQIAGLLDQSASLTLSAWVNSTDSAGEIISIGDNAGFRFSSDSISFEIYSYYSYRDINSWLPISARVQSPVSQWHFVSLVIDSAAGQISLYMDAVLQTQAAMIGELAYNKTGTETLIGRAVREDFNLKGLIDEVRVCKMPRNAAWLSLCFENQRSGGRLVSYRGDNSR